MEYNQLTSVTVYQIYVGTISIDKHIHVHICGTTHKPASDLSVSDWINMALDPPADVMQGLCLQDPNKNNQYICDTASIYSLNKPRHITRNSENKN